MNWLFLGLTSTSLFAFLNLSDKTTAFKIYICSNATVNPNAESLELIAAGPNCTLPTTTISRTCVCLVSLTSSSNNVSIETSHTTANCDCDLDDTAALEIIKDGRTESVFLQGDNLTSYSQSHINVSQIGIDTTICSICGSTFTVILNEASDRSVNFSRISCTTTSQICNSSSTATATSAITTRRYFPTEVNSSTVPSATSNVGSNFPTEINSSTVPSATSNVGSNFPTEVNSSTVPSATSNVGSTNETMSPATSSNRGLIVGVVVGVAVGFLLIVAIILSLFILRRRRAKRQLEANQEMTHHDAPVENSYEIMASSAAAVSYENVLSSTQLQNGTIPDSQHTATGSFAAETDQNYYSVNGTDNNAFHQSDAVTNSARTSSEYDNFVPELHSNNDTDVTLIENDMYGI